MDVAAASLVPNRKRKEIFCHVSGRERSSSSHHLWIQKRYEKAYQTFPRLIFSLSSWLSLSLPAPMGWTTKRQTIIAVSCRLFPFHPGSQSPPAIWCPMEISTIICRMGVCFFGRKKDVWSACCRRGLYTMIHRPWYTASLPVPAARQLVDVQQAQCFRSASHLLQVGRSSIPCMLSPLAHSPLPDQVRGPFRKVSSYMENHGQSILAATLPALFSKHCSDQAAKRHVVKLFYYY